MKTCIYPLTYFTGRNQAELDEIIADLHTILPKDEIVNLFIERFNPDVILSNYGVAITDKLEEAIRKTLQYDIDTEMLIRYIFDKIDRGIEE